MPEPKKVIRCTSCNNILAEVEWMKDGKIKIKCKCGTTNTVQAEQTKKRESVHEPFQYGRVVT